MPHDERGVWNRDAAYHAWIVRIAAEHAGDVLDVGCGDGTLVARLAEVSHAVVGIDRDPVAVGQARKTLQFVPGAAVEVSEFSSEWGLEPSSYDVITMVSTLQELPLRPALLRARELLKPGGSLLVVGTARPATPFDTAWAAAAEPLAEGLRLFYSWRGMYRPEFVTEDAPATTQTFAEVHAAVAELLPGAQLRRGLLGRYRLRWSKPVAVPADAEVSYDTAQPEEAEAPVLAPDDVDELSHMFDQTREVPTLDELARGRRSEPGQGRGDGGVRRSA
ncbi:class I SAM-dependent methyltransferase [Gryllotalpicola ginsengisoli]|uniref:class I SAM-dependent methyltransferase n=1 Tax=Gryllotalpicola ginsengisoli TaxID=444608 RepID=UPI0003B52C6B|nr:class I SAM-dependent methyltransferase [Gryllotalpicola ginsengisoli]